MIKKISSVIFSFCILSSLAFADPVKDRLDSLEKIIQSIQNDSISRNEKLASSLETVESLKQEYQSLQGTIESNDHIIRAQQDEISRFKTDLSDRMAAIEERLAIYDEQITKAVAKVLPQIANEMDSYQKALDMVHKSDFLTAVASFRTFLKAYPKSEFADNAQFWIGECYFALKDHSKAIKEFQAVADKYPKSDKISGAVLKQGLSFAELNMPEEAKMFLNKVVKDFAGSDDAMKAREKIEKIDQTVRAPKEGIPLAPGVTIPPSVPNKQ